MTQVFLYLLEYNQQTFWYNEWIITPHHVKNGLMNKILIYLIVAKQVPVI